MENKIKIASCQLEYIEDNSEKALKKILYYVDLADGKSIDIVCFPECYLNGYFLESNFLNKTSVNLKSNYFTNILYKLSTYKPIIILGLSEKENNNLFNTSVVIKSGKLIGKYRKINLLSKEKNIFSEGNLSPFFKINDIKFGVNICNDMNNSQYSNFFNEVGCNLLIGISNNMLPFSIANKWKYLHNKIRGNLAKENKIWILSSDVIGEKNGKVSFGSSSLINPEGKIIKQLPFKKEGILIYEIPS